MTQESSLATPSLETIAKNLEWRLPKVDSLDAAIRFMNDNLSLIPLSDADKNTVTAMVVREKGYDLVHYHPARDFPNESNLQLGKKMLQESARRGLQIDFDKLEAYVVGVLAHELRKLRSGYYEITVNHLNYAFNLIDLSAGLGHAI